MITKDIDSIRHNLQKLNGEATQELENILSYWMKYTIDEENGGFTGRITHDNKVHPEAPKGSVLNCRILYAFSSAFNLTGKQEYLHIAGRAYHYIVDHFKDAEYGGVYWTVSYDGKPLDNKKQIYAMAYAVYALSEYYLASKDPKAKEEATSMYRDIITYGYDSAHGGYIEALTRSWQPEKDLRLSDKDANEKKSMNTHLHLLEAFCTLFRIWPDNDLRSHIKDLCELFLVHIIDLRTSHLVLFFNDEWKPKSRTISYGHDIEAAWLLHEAAGLIADKDLTDKIETASLQLANAAAKAIDHDGGLWYEYEPETRHLIKEKHWWPQAEAVIGFLNTWQITREEKFLNYSLNTWQFIQDHIIDKQGGEWYWGICEDNSIMDKEDKVGIWKCPYHNSRTCIEIIKRTKNLV